MLYTKENILHFLPHRDPFLFVDAVQSVELAKDLQEKEGAIEGKDLIGAQVVAHYKTKADHPIFKGHFPGRPILPGVVQIEMMAQASSFVLCKLLKGPIGPDHTVNLDVALLCADEAKFRRPIYPDMDLIIRTTCTRYRSNMMGCECKIFHQEELMSECQVMAFVKF